MKQFQTLKQDLDQTRIVNVSAAERVPLSENAIRVRIERFGLSANNITYAVTGELLGYWNFFPASNNDNSEWGLMPVWGFAEVTETRVEGVSQGERLFGYFPPATELDIIAGGVTEERIIDVSPHRASLPAPYNLYRRVDAEPGYDRSTDDVRMLFWPLYVTSFLLWDFLQDRQWYGAGQVVILSASSKTAIGMAYAMQDDTTAPPSVAMTSSSNAAFVNELSLYDRTVCYDDAASLDSSRRTLLVDMSGNGDLLQSLSEQLGDNMVQCVKVGITHHEQTQDEISSLAERSHFFFAPNHVSRRIADWGSDEFNQRIASFMKKASISSMQWLRLKTLDGLEGMSATYADVCHGRVPAEQGLVVIL